MSYSDLSDEDLLDLIQKHELDAFEELYERYFDKIYYYLKTKSNIELAEDLTQSCFIKIFEKSKTYQSSYPVSAWIYTIAKNLLMDEFRSESRKNKYYERLKTFFSRNDEENIKQQWIDLMFDMNDLDDKHKEVLTLRFKEGLEFDEIAKILKTSPVNARKLVSRALKNFKILLEIEDSL